MSDPQIVIETTRWEKIRDICISIAAISIPILAFAVAIQGQATRDISDVAERIEGSAECRFDENAEISDINDWIDYWTAVGLRASVAGNDDQLREALNEIDRYTELFREQIATRSSIAERCSATVEPVGSPPSTDEVP